MGDSSKNALHFAVIIKTTPNRYNNSFVSPDISTDFPVIGANK